MTDDELTDGEVTDGEVAGDAVPGDEVAERLRTAPLEVVGRFADASNATLLVRLTDRGPRSLDDLEEALGRAVGLDDLDPDDLAVYKPRRGEAPLWDFPDGTLHRREIAAAVVSDALGWGLVPTTVLRDDAPFGVGSLQRFVAHDPQEHFFTLLEGGDPEVVAHLRAMTVFDLVIDNADRKAGHVLAVVDPPPGGPPIRVVDHGVSFHVEDKLRTVAWSFADEELPDDLRAEVTTLAARLGAEGGAGDGALLGVLHALLAPDEVIRLAERAARVARLRALPRPDGPRAYPWPLL